MALSELEFHILNVLADGSEPFSMICHDVMDDAPKLPLTIAKIAEVVCMLCERGLVRPEDTDNVVSPSLLVEHYGSELEQALVQNWTGFYASKGEYFFEMTEAGRRAWSAYEYR